LAKFTFKRQPRTTGPAGVGYPYQSVDIKMNGKVVGVIDAPNHTNENWKWKVSFMVYKDEAANVSNCSWKWVFFNKGFENETSARQWITDNCDRLQMELNLRAWED